MTAPREERFVRLDWHGPFSYGEEGLAASLLDRFGPRDNELSNFVGKAGLYLVLGDHPTHGSRTLLYIGRTNEIGRRFKEHHSWIKEEWRVEIYLAVLEDPALLSEVEALLIYAQTPPYNSSVGSPPRLPRVPLRVWNCGRHWKLYPEVSSAHPWNSM